MKLKKISILFLCLGAFCAGCSTNEKEEKIQEEFTNHSADMEENSETGQTNIQETIMEHLTVNAKIEIPKESLASYATEIKKFDAGKVAELLWSESSEKEIHIEEYDAGAAEVTFQDESVALGPGTMMYDKNSDITYVSGLVAFAEESNLLEEKELGFMTVEQAVKNVETFLEKLELGGELGEKRIFSLSKENLSSIQEMMKKDEDYKYFYESGKYQEHTWDSEDELYYLKYKFSVDGVPILGVDSPTVQMSGGMDRPLLAYPIECNVLFSNDGICEVKLMGMLGQMKKETEKQEIIQYDGIKNALIKKFGDVILSDDYHLSSVQMEYFPKIKEDSFEEVEVIPVWCCKFEINGEEVDYALRFHAFTGEEIS